MSSPAPDLSTWVDIVDRYQNPEGEVTIAVIGKYVGLPDAYKSLNEALVHGGMAHRCKVNIRWIDAELFEQEDDEIAARLEPMHAILVPGGFGERGTEGKIASVRFARERGVPFFGICLGMQLLFRRSEEEDAECLGIIDADVERLPDAPDLPIPEMGWNQIEIPAKEVVARSWNPAVSVVGGDRRGLPPGVGP